MKCYTVTCHALSYLLGPCMQDHFDHPLQDHFVRRNSWTGTGYVLYVEQLYKTSTGKEWAEVKKQIKDNNPWSAMAEENRAKRNYALANNVKEAKVTIEEIEQHPLGIQGWAQMQVQVTAGGGLCFGQNG